MKSKNLFDFASKELSQDAFLCWLVSNIDDVDIKQCANEFLDHIFGLGNVQLKAKDIAYLEADTQVSKIDIVINLIDKEGKQYLVTIEDKTVSDEHNQLEKYMKTVKSLSKGKQWIGIFYKTDYMFESEVQRVNKASWKIFTYKKIDEVFSKYLNSDNLVLRDYSNHVHNRYVELQNKSIPIDRDNENLWLGLFRNCLKESVKELCDCWSYTTRFGYSVFGFRPKGIRKGRPYVEMRTRDIKNGVFNLKFLTYDAEDYVRKYGIDKIISVIKKHVDNSLIVLEKNPKKQFTHSKNLHYSSSEDLVNLIKQSVEIYNKIFSEIEE